MTTMHAPTIHWVCGLRACGGGALTFESSSFEEGARLLFALPIDLREVCGGAAVSSMLAALVLSLAVRVGDDPVALAKTYSDAVAKINDEHAAKPGKEDEAALA